MNYRHTYHAGNFADVLKHTVLTVIIEHLKLKNAPFRVIDTHAGAGLYDLDSEEARKTSEWQAGIGRLMPMHERGLPNEVAELFAPYLRAVTDANPDGGLRFYPGSPRLALSLMRPMDRLIANELHPNDAIVLNTNIGRDRRAKVLQLDAWVALKSLLPPKERRGLVLIDPPFEAVDEFDKLALGLDEAVRRFVTGTYLLWYPIKDPQRVGRFRDRIIAAGHTKALSVELFIGTPHAHSMLNGCGLLILNPPHTLHAKLSLLSQFLPQLLAQGTSPSMHIAQLGASDCAEA